MWKWIILPNLYKFYNTWAFARFFTQDKTDLENEVLLVNFDYDCQMDQAREVMKEMTDKLRNGHNSRRYKVMTNYTMKASDTLESRLGEVVDQSKRVIAVVTKEALDLAAEHELIAMQFDMTVRVLTSVISHKYDLL